MSKYLTAQESNTLEEASQILSKLANLQKSPAHSLLAQLCKFAARGGVVDSVKVVCGGYERHILVGSFFDAVTIIHALHKSDEFEICQQRSDGCTYETLYRSSNF